MRNLIINSIKLLFVIAALITMFFKELQLVTIMILWISLIFEQNIKS